MEDCIFCKIASNQIPSHKIYEDDLVVAFLDVHPASKGHTLVVPKKHARDIFELDEKTLERVASVGKKVAHKMKDSLGADGVNFYHASGSSAEQTVFHFHLHVISRKKDDLICFSRAVVTEKNASSDELAEIASKLKIEG
jgi:histidine triad (HIT) family protein